uniref:NosF n=2 Tax=Streptomyces TaxID=1883 RepID=C6FX45_STRAS|nr:NosF [Streptomyces actuosus]
MTTDEAYTYTTGLRLDPRSANPDGWRVDWADGPWPVKVYSGARRLPLRPDGPPPLAALHRLLHGGFAVSRIRTDPSGGIAATPADPRPHHGPEVQLRRPVPSGGAMYPTEVYAALTATGQVCHYDPYRHELTVLAGGDAAARLRAALHLPTEAAPAAVLVLTSRFWKNFYKYGDFATRLGLVDAGVALGRAARLARAEWEHAEVRTVFDDEAVHACLGLDGEEENAWAAVTLGPYLPYRADTGGPDAPPRPALLERSRTVRRSDRFTAFQRAAREDTSTAAPARPPEDAVPATAPGPVPGDAGPAAAPGPVHEDAVSAAAPRPVPGDAVPVGPVPLPAPRALDLLAAETAARRFSRGRLFTGAEADGEALAGVLGQAAEALRALAGAGADGPAGWAARTRLYCAVHRVRGVPPGWYRYAHELGALLPVGEGTGPGSARRVQEALFAASFNAELAAFTVHPVTPADWRPAGGPRAYRAQQLAVGAAIEAVTLAAAAEGLSGHAVLGFDVTRIDTAYGLDGGADTDGGTQAQICVGAVRPDPNWEIAVMPR